MQYREAVEYLFASAPMFQQVGAAGYKEGLENTIAIDKRLNHPHKNYRTIHVGGTNGKGSTAHLIASILQESGYKTGLYTSPHLIDFRERIKINGDPVEEQFVVDFVEKHRNFCLEIKASFFEFTTGMAFEYFASQQIDVAVIEVGLGGRLDCTNIISPDLSIITNISFDHTAILGKSLTAIAIEKAGIIKPETPVVIGETTGETKPIFLETADRVHQHRDLMCFAEQETPILHSHHLPDGQWEFETKNYGTVPGQLGGLAQEKNAATVLCAVDRLKTAGYQIPDQAVRSGFKNVIPNTGLSGRWQTIKTNPKTVFDTGHNEAGIRYVVQRLQYETCRRLHLVTGLTSDKAIDNILRLLPTEASYYFTQADIPRALDHRQLKEQADRYGLKGTAYPTVREALQAANSAAHADDLIFVGGSTFVVADAFQSLIQSDKQ